MSRYTFQRAITFGFIFCHPDWLLTIEATSSPAATNGTGFTVLTSFSSAAGLGQNQVSGLILGKNGALYGATTYGGANDAGMIYQLTTNTTPVFSILHSFDISDENSARPSLVQRGDGRIFGTTFFGGSEDLGTVFAMDPDGNNFQVLKEFLTTSTGSGWYPDGALTEGAAGVFYGTTYDGGAGKVGTIYRINNDGSGYTVLHSLGEAAQDGTNSAAPLTLSGGMLYGTTLFGGTYGGGTVFKIGIAGDGYTRLHDFGSAQDGATLWGRVIIGLDGLLYGTTLEGGTHGKGTVFKMDTNGGSYSVLYNFGADANDGANPYTRLAQGGDGTLFGVTYAGGTGDAGTIFNISTNGTAYSVLHDFGITDGDGSHPWAGILVNSGMLYGTTYDGGTNNLGTVFRINANGSGYTILHSFSAEDAQHPYSALVLGSDAAIYGTTWLGGSADRGAIFRIRSDGTYDLLYSFDQGKNPYCRLYLGSDGLFYGTTESGGTYNLGTAFRMQVVGEGGLDLSETSTLTLRVMASDPDPDESLTYSLEAAPDGMTIGPDTGVITWTPAEGTGPGTYSLTVKVTDNGLPPMSVTTNFTITVNEKVMNTTTMVQSSVNPSMNGQSVTFTATVSKAGGDDDLTGTVSFKDGGVSLGSPVALNGDGQATLATSGLAVGIHSITAEFSGATGVYNGSTGTVTHSVSKANTTTTIESNLDPSLEGQLVTFKATVTPVAPGTGTPGGTVTFKDSGITLGSASLDGTGCATFPTTAVGVGTRAITAEYDGDSSFEGSIGNIWQTVEDAGTWTWGGSYTWRISSATGSAGTDWDLVNIAGPLDITATIESPFTIKVVSLDGSSAGEAANFDNTQSYTWRIATASGGVTGFAADEFAIDDSGFQNGKGTVGAFSISQSGNDVYLDFTPVFANAAGYGRAWGTFQRLSVNSLLSNYTTGNAARELVSVATGSRGTAPTVRGGLILLAPTNNFSETFQYVVQLTDHPSSLATNIITLSVTNAVSRINGITSSGSSVTIKLAGVPGYIYVVERTSDVSNGPWTVIPGSETNAPSTGLWTFTDLFPPNPSFYRTRQNN